MTQVKQIWSRICISALLRILFFKALLQNITFQLLEMAHRFGSAKSQSLMTFARQWILMDAQGQELEGFGHQVCKILEGRHKPIYNHVQDVGDHVVVINTRWGLLSVQLLQGRRVWPLCDCLFQQSQESMSINRLFQSTYSNIYDKGSNPHCAGTW